MRFPPNFQDFTYWIHLNILKSTGFTGDSADIPWKFRGRRSRIWESYLRSASSCLDGPHIWEGWLEIAVFLHSWLGYVSWMVIKCHKSHINPRFCSGFWTDSMQIILYHLLTLVHILFGGLWFWPTHTNMWPEAIKLFRTSSTVCSSMVGESMCFLQSGGFLRVFSLWSN